MKKSYFLLSLVSLLVVTGCNNKPNDSQNTNTDGSASNGIISNVEGAISDWSEQDKSDMQEAIGMILPVAPLTSAYQNESYVDDYDNAFTFYVYDETIGDQSAAYGSSLVAAGFTYDGSDDTYGYEMNFYYKENGDNSYAYVQIDYFPTGYESEGYNPCFEIYAWTYTETPTIDVEPMAWSTQDKADMQEAIGMILPEAPLSSSYQNESFTDSSDGAFTFYVFDETVGDQTSTYGEILTAAGFTFDYSDDSYGYEMQIYYLDLDDGNSACVQIDYFPTGYESEGYNPCFEIYAWTYSDGGITYNEWPASSIAAFINDSSVTVPSFESDSYAVYDYSEYGFYMYLIEGEVESNIETAYTTALISAGWTVDDSDYEESGYVATLKNVSLVYYYDTDDNGDGYFMLMIMIDDESEDGSETEITVTGAITLLPSNFSSYGTDVELTVDSITFIHTNVMKGSKNGDCIQIKKQTGTIKNTTAIANGIDTIEIKDKYTGEYAGSVTVYAIADDGTKTAITGENDVYSLNGAKYFEIANESSNAFYCSSIIITPIEAE